MSSFHSKKGIKMIIRKLWDRNSLPICLTLMLLIPGGVFAGEKPGAFAEKNSGKNSQR